MKRLLYLSLVALNCSSATARAEPFELKDGERVVFLGSTLIEREQRYGYWETALTLRYPERNVRFRNLGWSGDTVFGEARAGFGTVADGFRQLREHVEALKPTVIFVGYGTNESFAGAAGLPRFLEGLNVLLDTIASTKARIILLSPTRQEDLGRPLPDPAAHNRDLRLYCDALRETASRRGLTFVDLYELLNSADEGRRPLTDNGLHLTAYGYWRSATSLEKGLGLKRKPWTLDFDKGQKLQADGAKLEIVQNAPSRFKLTDAVLPFPPPPADPRGTVPAGPAVREIRLPVTSEGSFTLKVDGKPVATAGGTEWASGVKLIRGPEFEQVEKLRQAIVDKNRLFFHRWRPQNETYLYGFRKHEQGKNAREIVQFDPLVANLEGEIAKLRVPTAHVYELVPAAGSNK